MTDDANASAAAEAAPDLAPQVTPEPAVEVVAQEPAAEPQKQPPPKWMLDRVAEETRKRQEADQRAQRAEQAARDAQALAERMSRGDKPDSQPAPRAEPTHPDDAELDRRADYKLFLRDVESVRSKGLQEYGPKFNEAIRALAAVGADSDTFVQQVMAVDRDKAHVLLDGLAQDLERTVALVNMDSHRRLVELTKMSMSAASPQAAPKPAAEPVRAAAPARQVSKAPPPAPALEPATSTTKDWRTDPNIDDAEWSKNWDRDRAEKHSARVGR